MEELISELKNSKFSLLIDESTDVAGASSVNKDLVLKLHFWH